MTYNPAVPLNSNSPGIFPAQSQANFTRLQTLLGADHQFNLSAAANDGYHNLVHLTQQAPSGALAATGRIYVKSSAGRIHAFYMDDTGGEYQVTPTMPIRAAVNFNGIGAPAIRSQYNVASVVRNAAGTYTITFTTPMPDTNYIVQVTGMRDDNSKVTIAGVYGDPTYTNSVKTTSVKVIFFGQNTGGADVIMGNVTIFSVT